MFGLLSRRCPLLRVRWRGFHGGPEASCCGVLRWLCWWCFGRWLVLEVVWSGWAVAGGTPPPCLGPGAAAGCRGSWARWGRGGCGCCGCVCCGGGGACGGWCVPWACRMGCAVALGAGSPGVAFAGVSRLWVCVSVLRSLAPPKFPSW